MQNHTNPDINEEFVNVFIAFVIDMYFTGRLS